MYKWLVIKNFISKKNPIKKLKFKKIHIEPILWKTINSFMRALIAYFGFVKRARQKKIFVKKSNNAFYNHKKMVFLMSFKCKNKRSYASCIFNSIFFNSGTFESSCLTTSRSGNMWFVA